jgi:hypothetical protein
MVQLEVSNRYQSREGLLKFLRQRFGYDINFNVTETSDGHFRFEAPENLTEVNSKCVDWAQTRLINIVGGVEVSRPAGSRLSPVKLMRGNSDRNAKG